jgi:hypothetical protein
MCMQWTNSIGRFVSVFLFAGALGLAGCSEAALLQPDELAGKWRFKTTGDYEGYVNGSLVIEATKGAVTLCKLTVYQSEFGSAVETCRVEIEGEAITITVEDIVTSSVPNWRKEVFVLALEEDAMTGMVLIVVEFPVIFTRKT